jgi:hypothetical protein
MTTPPGWQLTERRGREGVRSLEAEWRQLYVQMPWRTSFISFEACLAYLDHCHDRPDQVRCLVLSDDRQVRAICVLEPRTERRLGLGIGVWGVLWMNRQCHHADLVCADDALRRELVPLLAGHLRRHPEGRRLLALGPLEVDASIWEGMRQQDPVDRCQDRNERIRVLDCRRSFAQVEAACSKKLRRDLHSAQNRLARGREISFRVARGPQALAGAVPAFLDLEASGWKGRAKSAIRFKRGVASYFTELALALAGDKDYCEIVSLYSGDRCIASQYTIRTGSTCSFTKIAYDEDYSRFSPGQLVVAHAIERCCEDPGIERINLVSDAAWMGGWPSDLVDVQTVFVNIGGLAGRALISLVRFRLGTLRRLARWIEARRQRPAPPAEERQQT